MASMGVWTHMGSGMTGSQEAPGSGTDPPCSWRVATLSPGTRGWQVPRGWGFRLQDPQLPR